MFNLPIITKILLVACFFLSACTANWPHALHTSQPDIELISRPSSILIVTRDSRPKSELVSAERAGYCVGSITQLMGAPIPAMTADGYSLAGGVAQSICDAFASKGWQCTPEESHFKGDIRQEIGKLLPRFSASKILYININEWFARTGTTSTELTYNFNLTLWNRSSQLLGSIGENGTRNFPVSSYLNPAENAGINAPLVLSEILSGLLKEPKLVGKI